MNILVIGSGAVGIGIGTSMLSQNADVSFLASENTAQEMRKFGVKRCGLFKHYSFMPDEFNVYTKYSQLPVDTFDYVFITSKTTVNEDISKKLQENRQILKNDSKIIIFQNGFGNDSYYLKYFKKEMIFCARVITSFTRPKRHISEVTVYTEPILLGSLQNCDINDLKTIADKITSSGIKCELTDELDKYLWAKMLYNCSLNPLGAILNFTYGQLSENPFSKKIMDEIIDEIFEVIKANNYQTLWDSSDEYKEVFYTKLIPDTYNHYSSTHQDIQRKIKTEIDSLNGKVIELGKKQGVNVRTNEIIYNLIKSIESRF